ncbi:MAG: ComF family protein [Clostridia bacterium]|nr:ComF family protein [Clostridia bacterium]
MIDLLNLLYPKRCAVCGVKTGNRDVCEDCDRKFRALKSPDYEEPSKYFNVKADSVVWLFEYRDDFVKKLIYSYKYRHSPALAKLFAGLLAERIERSGVPSDAAVMTFVPRSGRNITEYGFDQAKMLAKALARRLKIKTIQLYKHVPGHTEQKSLTRAERMKNAPSSFRLKRKLAAKSGRGVDLRGKTVFIVDDVITTGASVNSCISKLRGGGYKRVVAVCIAKV